MPITPFAVAQEAGIKYVIINPGNGARAVLNDPADTDFCGYLDGEDAITGLDSPEIRDSYTDRSEFEGGVSGDNFYSRRPIVLNGKVIPSSAADRNVKLGKLMAATDARFTDAVLQWTPSGGEPVFVRFRRQLPFRAKGGFNKDFQVGLVANDPRIYSLATYYTFTETNGNSTTDDYRRVTAGSGTTNNVVYKVFYIPPGRWTMSVPVRRSTSTGVARMTATAASVVSMSQVSLTTSWQMLETTFDTTNARTSATYMNLYLNSPMSSGQWIEVGDPVLESHDGHVLPDNNTFATNWVAQASHIPSFRDTSPKPPRRVVNPGTARAFPTIRMLGPLSGSVSVSCGSSIILDSVTLSGSDYITLDYRNRTAIKNSSANVFNLVRTSGTDWGGIRARGATAELNRIRPHGGATTATRMETMWRGAWL